MVSEKFKEVKVLDCSLRDGGHLNKWGFSEEFGAKLAKAVSQSGAEYIELGYRSTPGSVKGAGIWRYTTDELINKTMVSCDNIKVAIMADIGKINKDDFKPKKESMVDLVRLAFYKEDIDEAIELADDLIKKGYVVTFNMMGVTKYTQEEVNEAIAKIRESNIDILYIADSFGALQPSEVRVLIKTLKEGTGKRMGYHAHNNLELALANTIAAIEAGAEYVDATMNGMGRGAGNLTLETILLFLNKFNNEKYNVIPVLNFIEQEVSKIKKKISWGYDLNYILSGIANCHPNYSLALKDKGYNIEQTFSILSSLKKIENLGFSEEILAKAINKTIIVDKEFIDPTKLKLDIKKTKPVYVNRHKGKDFLIIATGPSLNEHLDKIKEFAEKNNLITIGCNYLGKKITPKYHLFNNLDRFTKYVSSVDEKSTMLLGKYLHEEVKDVNLPKYEIAEFIAKEGFDIDDGTIYADPSTVAVLMIGVAIVMGAENIYVVGMDGYKNLEETHFYEEESVSRLDTTIELQRKMTKDLKEIKNYLEKNNKKVFKIITPTTFTEFHEKGVL